MPAMSSGINMALRMVSHLKVRSPLQVLAFLAETGLVSEVGMMP